MMYAGLKRRITIEARSNEEKREIGNRIHQQLVGNKDYIDSNIILNVDEDKIVEVLIFPECANIPEITI